jgi:peptide deformylase
MAIRPITKYGDSVLRKKCKLVTEINAEIRTLIRDMFDTMYDAPGIGLAANQIGVPLSIAVIDLQTGGKRSPIVMINPQVVEVRGRLFEEEGCLSIPGMASRVKRYAYARVAALNENGLPMIYSGEGLMARALQHETDHLNGKFYVDRMPLIRRLKYFARVRKKKKLERW